MDNFFLFIRKIHVYILFVILEVLAIGHYQSSSIYAEGVVLTYSRNITYDANRLIGGVVSFFNLEKENRQLTERIAYLGQELEAYKATLESLTLGDTIQRSIIMQGRYNYTPAQVIGNSIVKLHNYITINKGRRDGIKERMALVSNGNIIGYVVGVSERFAVATSILNIDFKTSGKLKGSEFYGSIYWDGISPDRVFLNEVPKYATISVGDTVTTTTYSSIFPSDLMIGIVDSYELINGTYYTATVKLEQKMGILNNVVAVEYLDIEERDNLTEKFNTTH